MKKAQFTLTIEVDDEILTEYQNLEEAAREIIFSAPGFDTVEEVQEHLEYQGEVK